MVINRLSEYLSMQNMDKVLVAVLAAGLFAAFFLVVQKPLYVDEVTHFSVISNFCKFKFEHPDFLTTIPGYHFFGGLFGYLADCSESWIRFFNLIVSIAAIFVVYNLAKEMVLGNRKWMKPVRDHAPMEKVLLFALLPILFPFFFLIYTDVLSLLFVLLMFYFLVRGEKGGDWENFLLSGIFGLASFAVRQNNIIWVLFAVAYAVSGNEGGLQDKVKAAFKKDFIRNMLPFIFVLAVAAGFFIKVGGFALGDRGQHPSFFVGPMNIYTILFFLFWINLPEQFFNFRKIVSGLKGIRMVWLLAVAAAVILFYAFFLLGFKIDHPYNNYNIYSYFLRNKILHFFDSSFLLRSAFFLCALYSVFSLATIKFREKRQYLVYAFSLLYLMPSWLIENRYFIIPFVFFNLFALRGETRPLIAWYLIGTVAYMYLFLTGWTFW